MDLSNISRKGLEQALQKALRLLPPEGVEEVVATFPERLPAIDHKAKKTSQALGIGDDAFYTVAKAATEFGKTLMQEGEQLRSKHVESMLRIWRVFGEREKALFTVLLAEFTLQQMAKTLSERFLELAIRAHMAEAGWEGGGDETEH